MTVYRIANCQYIDDLSGRGAAMYGGRWNSKEVYMLYTAESPALALLETVVHVARIPEKGYCMIELEIPGNSMQAINADQLPADWFSNPAPDHLKTIGDHFIAAHKHLVLSVPSAIMPEEHNLLINPRHADFKKIKITRSRSVAIDGRLLRG